MTAEAALAPLVGRSFVQLVHRSAATLLGLLLALTLSTVSPTGAEPMGADPAKQPAKQPAKKSTRAWLEERIDLDLEAAPAQQVLAMFAQVLEAKAEIDPAVGGDITITLFDVTARTALNATCESLGCRWRLVGTDPTRLVVEPLPRPRDPAPGSEASLSLELDRVEAQDAFETVARISGLPMIFDSRVEGEVSLTLVNGTVDEVLDELCRQVRCLWEISEEPGGTVLRVHRSPNGAEGVGAPSGPA